MRAYIFAVIAALCIASAQAGENPILPFGVKVGGQPADGGNLDIPYAPIAKPVANDAEVEIAKKADSLIINIFPVNADGEPADNPAAIINAPNTNKIKLSDTLDKKKLPDGQYHMTIVAGDACALVRFSIGKGAPVAAATADKKDGDKPAAASAKADAPKTETAAKPDASAKTAAKADAAAKADEDDDFVAPADEKAAAEDLCRFAQWGEIDKVKKILKLFPKVVDASNGDPLRSAVGLKRSAELTKILLDAGAKPESVDANSGENLLHIALNEANEENAKETVGIIQALVAKGANVNLPRKGDGLTPIHLAARKEQVTKEMMGALLAAKAPDVNVRTSKEGAGIECGWTPLFYACHRGAESEGKDQIEIVEMLVGKGADVKAEAQEMIEKRPAEHSKWTALQFLANSKVDRPDIAEFLLSKGAVLDAKDYYDCTPLHQSLMDNHPKLCQFLLEKGASINIALNSKHQFAGVTPLSHANAAYKDSEAGKVIQQWAKGGKGAGSEKKDSTKEKSDKKNTSEKSKDAKKLDSLLRQGLY